MFISKNSALAFGIIVFTATACNSRDTKDQSAQQNQQSSGATRSTEQQPSGPTTGTQPITYSRVRYYDLTGDSAAERISVKAQGSRYDSLNVVLEIRSAKDALLYRQSWNSILYFVYDETEGKSAADIEKIVRTHLDSVLAERAFEPRYITGPKGKREHIEPDSETIRYDIAEEIWRKNHELSAMDSLPVKAYEELGKISVPADRIGKVTADVQGMPTFTFFSGGEYTRTLAWSQSEGRFVEIWSCC